MTTALFAQPIALPCTDRTSSLYGCDPTDAKRCVACPIEPAFAGVGCCIQQARFGTNMRGEFAGVSPSAERNVRAGGHALGLVGYSDTYPRCRGPTYYIVGVPASRRGSRSAVAAVFIVHSRPLVVLRC